MNESDRESCRRKLGYDMLWITSGLLDLRLLRHQCRELAEDDASESGQFRHAAFRQILQDRATLEDDTLDLYLALARRDPDPMLGTVAVLELLRWPGLADAQFSSLADRDDLVDPRGRTLVAEMVAQMELLRALRTDVVSDALFHRCLAAANPGIHAALIGHAGISDPQLHALRLRAATPRLRNLAAQTLKARARDSRS